MSGSSSEQVLAGAGHALDELASLLSHADLNGLVAASPQVESAALALGGLDRSALRHLPDARARLESLQRSLRRCRRLGASLSDAVRLSHAAHAAGGSSDTYGPAGATASAPMTRVNGHTVDAQV
jgi:hypothetical protein